MMQPNITRRVSDLARCLKCVGKFRARKLDGDTFWFTIGPDTDSHLQFALKFENLPSLHRWLYTGEAPQSGSAVLEIENPTGYVLYQPDGDEVVAQGQRNGSRAKQLRDVIGGHAHGYERSTTWFFDYVSCCC